MKEKKAILYVRVSTDEQAEKGHSLAHQEERLRSYCAYHNIEIVAFFKEDYSAKTFERPEFNKLIDFVRKNKSIANILLFLKWDRFSRNAPEAYAMISKLFKLGIEPQAVEQPLNLEIPEQKFMLALYLTSPEVENDRRALNVTAGMRRAAKDGRYMGMAPYGYKHGRTAANKPCIQPNDDAPLVKTAFEKLATGLYHIEEVRKEMNKHGLKASRSRFWEMMRSPVYMGKVIVPSYKDEEEITVQGQHEPLISESLFCDVQDVLAGRKRKNILSSGTIKKELELRGYLKCRICGGNLTGSASKGRGGRYFYYHCKDGCKERFRADPANDLIDEMFGCVSDNKKAIKFFESILNNSHKNTKIDNSAELIKVKKEIDTLKGRLEKARNLLLDDKIDSADFKGMKEKIEPEINSLVKKQVELSSNNKSEVDIIDFGFYFLNNISNVFPDVDLSDKRKILGSTFPEKIIIEDNEVRTPEEDNVLLLITKPAKHLRKKKEGKRMDFSFPSCQVVSTGIEPVSKV